MPPACCMRNKNAPIDFPCNDVAGSEVDCGKIAEATVELLLERLRNPGAEPVVRWILPAPLEFPEKKS